MLQNLPIGAENRINRLKQVKNTMDNVEQLYKIELLC